MKTHYEVKVRENYSNFVDVYVEDESQIEEEISIMMESGEIEFDLGDNYDGWEIVSAEEVLPRKEDISKVKKWCMEMVKITSAVDPGGMQKSMDEYECMDWFEQLRDRGVDIPIEATSSDLWDAVEAYRKGDMGYGK